VSLRSSVERAWGARSGASTRWRLRQRKGKHWASTPEPPAAADSATAGPWQRRRWGWPARLAFGAGAAVILAGLGIVLVLVFGRPSVMVSSSDAALFRLEIGGWGTQLDGVTVTSAGKPVAVVREGGNVVPASPLAQGQSVDVSATVTPSSWSRWLLGGKVSTTKTLRTPSAAPNTSIALASRPGSVPVSFGHTVSVVDYQSAGGPTQVVRLRAPSEVADLPVPARAVAGSLQVAATPLPWERLATQPSSVMWFLAPHGGAPVALADPAPGATTAASNSPITITFAQPVASVLGQTRPTISPPVAGTWSEPGPNTLVFSPDGFGYGPGTAVTVGFDRPVSVVGADEAASTGPHVAASSASTAYHFSVAPGSMLRLEQILAQLHYLPLNFIPAPGVNVPTTFAGEVATMTEPLAGSFTWRWPSTPATLQAEWTVGSDNELLKGALMAFYSTQANYNGYQIDPLTVPQLANASTWQQLLQAAAENQVDVNPYAYVYVTQTIPETLTLWENGSVVLTSPTNTGISVAPTAAGTFPIYQRYTFNYMSGFNPDGSYYHDPVYWINYFNGGDAVHGFPRGSYGYPQSLGCVELPIPTAEVAFGELAVGDLVTVT
jgi:L,D-transpeptidase catalytic domain